MEIIQIKNTIDDVTDNNQGGLMSKYEKLRFNKIKRNEDKLKELGLYKFAGKKKNNKAAQVLTKKKQLLDEFPQERRLSTRKRKSVINYREERVIPTYDDDDDDDDDADDVNVNEVDEGSDDEDDYKVTEENDHNTDDEEDNEDTYIRVRPKKKTRKNSQTTTQETPITTASTPTIDDRLRIAIEDDAEQTDGDDGITIEFAKTGRSTCRKCRTKIDKGQPRVGMMAWIVGRNAMTWQHPICALQNIVVGYERSNQNKKGRCKATNVVFLKDDLKIGIKCHTAKSYYHLDGIRPVLDRILVSLISNDDKSDGFKLTIDQVEGNEKLMKDDHEKLKSVLKNLYEEKTKEPVVTKGELLSESNDDNDSNSTAKKAVADAAAAAGTDNARHIKQKRQQQQEQQPQVGKKSGANGRVEWKWCGQKCYGTLLPSKETKTHCYARTHKGNIKTLAKGKEYWSLL